ncbi:MAG: cation:proton antiporter [Candidatus Thermoplasmatota archaeon]|nr:cation:proton antiporter [Candidatus Thermoplasmatota archaeon]
MSLIFSLFMLLFSALIVGEAFERFGFPAVVGELLTGLILGPAVFDIIRINAVFNGLSEIALFFIVLLIGVEATTESLRKNYKLGLLFSFTSFVVPLSIMLAVSHYFLHIPETESVLLSISIAVPSISIISVLLKNYDLLRIEAGGVILASVIITDVISFAAASAFTNPNGITLEITGIIIFLTFLFLVDRLINKHSAQVIGIFERLHAKERGEKIIFGSIIISGLIISSIFEIIGITYVLGAFFAGIIISDVVVGEELQGIFTRTLTRLNDSFFIPIFFSIAGLNAIIPNMLSAKIILVLVGISGAIGGTLNYLFGRKYLKNIKGRTTAGIFGARGSVGIIIATVAYSSGYISNEYFSAAVFGTLILSFIFPPQIRKKDITLPAATEV